MKYSLLLLLLPATCVADGLIPSINTVPAFWGMLGENPTYRDAAFKAQEAFFIQTGVTDRYSLVTNYISNKVTRVAKTAEAKTALIINENTPLSSKYVFFVIGVSYAAIIRKEVSRSFRNPLFRSVSHTITLSQQSQSLNARIPF